MNGLVWLKVSLLYVVRNVYQKNVLVSRIHFSSTVYSCFSFSTSEIKKRAKKDQKRSRRRNLQGLERNVGNFTKYKCIQIKQGRASGSFPGPCKYVLIGALLKISHKKSGTRGLAVL